MTLREPTPPLPSGGAAPVGNHVDVVGAAVTELRP
jgi:hypothetical protein